MLTIILVIFAILCAMLNIMLIEKSKRQTEIIRKLNLVIDKMIIENDKK